MKGGLSAMAVACATLAIAKIPLQGSLVFATVIDEENRGTGAQRLVETGLKADWAVIGEPTGNTPVIVSNGQINFELTLHGQAGHGSTPSSGRNAIVDGIHLANAILKYAEQELPGRTHHLVGPASSTLAPLMAVSRHPSSRIPARLPSTGGSPRVRHRKCHS